MIDLSGLQVQNLVEQLSGLSTTIIACAFAVHLFCFLILSAWSNRDLINIASTLDDFTRELRNRSVLSSTSHLSDQIEAFITDVNEVLSDPKRTIERQTFLQRMSILDEKRRYLDSMFFDTCYNVCRTMIEAYPLAGVLGTILAIGAALRNTAGTEATATVSTIVGRFGDAIWSTFAGLCAAIILMFVNSLFETRFTRLADNRIHVRDMIARAKREVQLSASTETEA